MDELSCSLCGIEMKNKEAAYGLTSGAIDEDCFGFRMDSDSDWDVYCADCMNEIDKLLAGFRQSKKQISGQKLK